MAKLVDLSFLHSEGIAQKIWIAMIYSWPTFFCGLELELKQIPA